MPDEPMPDQKLDITGQNGNTIFCEPKSWLIEYTEQDLQAHIDERWRHYGEAKDDRLVALIGALCVENSIDLLLIAFAPGFPQYLENADFTFSIKTKILESLHLFPKRILNACDLIRQIRNQFAHNLDKKRFEDVDEKLRNKLEPCVKGFNNAPRNPNAPQRLFKDLVSFVLIALKVYTDHVSMLRLYIEDKEGKRGFKEWSQKNGAARLGK